MRIEKEEVMYQYRVIEFLSNYLFNDEIEKLHTTNKTLEFVKRCFGINNDHKEIIINEIRIIDVEKSYTLDILKDNYCFALFSKDLEGHQGKLWTPF